MSLDGIPIRPALETIARTLTLHGSRQGWITNTNSFRLRAGRVFGPCMVLGGPRL